MDNGHVGQLDRHRPLHSTEPSLPQMGDISNRQMHRPSRHSVWKSIASHCSLKKHDSLMAAAATIKIVRVYQTGVNVFIHIHTSFEARDSVDWVVLLYLFLLSFTKRHVYKLLLRLSKRDSCVFPLLEKSMGCRCPVNPRWLRSGVQQTNIFIVCWEWHVPTIVLQPTHFMYIYTSETYVPVQPELFIKLKQVCKYLRYSCINIVWEFRQLHVGNSWAQLEGGKVQL